MMKFLKSLFSIPKISTVTGSTPRVVEGFSGMPLAQTDEGRLGGSIMQGKCPDCGSTSGFYEGPSGGASTNIFCAGCGQGFNFTNMFGEGWAERIHKLTRQ